MIEYVIKSVLSLTILYFLYYLILRNIKTFEFNRFYFLFAIIFSIIIPFIQITTDINLTINQNIQSYSSSISSISIQSSVEHEQTDSILSLSNILLFVYLLISSILLIRFAFNIYKIIKTINNSNIVVNTLPKIILSTDRILPYSFFNNIIVNKTEYEKGEIDEGLILHEQAHCKQYHSIDILFVELIKVIFWFNPIIWIIKKEIQLNHEYLADNKVLKTKNLKSYQTILLNLVFRNNSTYLASNFNYSLTKKRLIMMTKNNSLAKSIVRKITIFPLVFLLTVTLTFSQKNLSQNSLVNFENEWWLPILEKHKIELLAFNNFQDVFEMGTSNSIDNKIVTLTDALFIIRENDSYKIVKSPLAYHDLVNNTISGDEGIMETFNNESEDTSPIEKHAFKKFVFKLNQDEKSYKFENVKVQVKIKK